MNNIASQALRLINWSDIKQFLANQSFGVRAIPQADITRLLRQLANLLTANVNLLDAITLLRKSQGDQAMQTLLNQIRQDLENGTRLSQALHRHPRYFDPLCCGLIASGEHAGVLGPLLELLCQYREQMDALHRKVRKALTYPSSVLILALLISWALLIWVIPTFENLYKGFASRLPWITQLLIDCSGFLQKQGLLFVMGLVVSILLIRFAVNQINWIQEHWQRFKFRLPLLGGLLRKSAIARFAMTLSTVLQAGQAMDKALDIVAGICQDKLFYNSVLSIRDDICHGMAFQNAVQKSGVFPPLVVQMISIGENAGTLPEMLHKIACYYSDDINYQVDQLTSLIEPALMVLLGGMIGGMILAMYLPIFSMGSVFS